MPQFLIDNYGRRFRRVRCTEIEYEALMHLRKSPYVSRIVLINPEKAGYVKARIRTILREWQWNDKVAVSDKTGDIIMWVIEMWDAWRLNNEVYRDAVKSENTFTGATYKDKKGQNIENDLPYVNIPSSRPSTREEIFGEDVIIEPPPSEAGMGLGNIIKKRMSPEEKEKAQKEFCIENARNLYSQGVMTLEDANAVLEREGAELIIPKSND